MYNIVINVIIQKIYVHAQIDNLLECYMVIGFINVDGCHWTLMTANGSKQQMVYYDSLRGSGAMYFDLYQ